MRILMAIKGLDDAVGGAERIFCLLADELVRRRHSVTVLTWDGPGGSAYFGLRPDVERVAFGIGRTDQPASLKETIRRISALRRHVTSAQPQVVLAFMHSMFVPFGLALTRSGIPMIAAERNVAALYAQRPLEWALVQLTPTFAARITVQSEQAKATYPKRLQQRMFVIPNPVQTGEVLADPAGGIRKSLLAVGRLRPQKDHRTLISAFARLADDFPDWDLKIVGDGPLRHTLEEQIVECGLAARIALPGTTRDITGEYQRAQLFVTPSRYEGFPGATAEALAHGVPAIGFADCPGTNELIENRTNGLLAAGADRVGALADAMRTLMSDGGLRARYGAAAPATLARFEPGRVFDRWEQLLTSVCNRS